MRMMISRRLHRWAAGLALASLLAGPVWAREQTLPTPVAPTLEAVEATQPLRPALWLVRDADTTIYLFGTIHLLKPGLNWLNGPIKDALTRSDMLVTEIVPEEGGGLALSRAMVDLALLPKGQTLRALMTPDQRKAFEALLAREGMKADAFDTYKPWYPSLVLSLLPLMKLGMVPGAGVEEKLGEAHGIKPREGLETVEFQLGLFDGLPQDAQLDYLAGIVAEYDNIGPQTEGLVDAWGKGDAEAIGAAMNAEMDTPVLADALLKNRNRAWAGWIEKRLDQPGTVFIAVGAGHLAGADSVQRQLAGEGIRTERVQ
jgi:uncharacterized protein YbaP (TraB family)